eukprot:CAMPEP_0170524620 /NCGR_PEP_ID=MMETSP0209-20121228/10104_1 /TAXON_ID=665100 ORGANISM="Litonotus pictus, Strain P1" /NCGR_SAMPLE_ID=MMETSP0209 /ASSEMBLY_ACC=CAM_ASM_000301 /LENGTH=217 /DNA_ID=CAMNT_0010813435 /DNA_START=170 /DNA_END=819 /DNA_ORIENTATION=-
MDPNDMINKINSRREEENFTQPSNEFNIDIYLSKSIKDSKERNKGVAEEALTNYIYDNSSLLHFTNHKVEFNEYDLQRIDNINKLHNAHLMVKEEKVKVLKKMEKEVSPLIKFSAGEILYNQVNQSSEKGIENNRVPSSIKKEETGNNLSNRLGNISNLGIGGMVNKGYSKYDLRVGNSSTNNIENSSLLEHLNNAGSYGMNSPVKGRMSNSSSNTG